jgi:hypothetical protein
VAHDTNRTFLSLDKEVGMGAWPMRRIGALGAFAFVVLNVVAFSIPGSMPDYGDDPATIASFFSDHHKSLLIAVVLIGIGLLLAVAAIGQLVDMLRTAGYADAAAAVGVSGAAVLGMLGVGIGIFGAMTQMARNGTDPGTLRAFYQAAQFVLSAPLAWVGLGLVIPVARVALAGALPRWVAGVNGIVAVAAVLGGISVRGDGVLAVGTGVFAWIAFIGFMVYFLEIAFLLWRSAPATATAARPAAAL